MSKLNKIKVMLQNMLMQFSQLSTDKGLISWNGEGEYPEIGDSIVVIDEEGNEAQAESGEYALEDGRILIIEDGKLTEIREVEQPVEGDDEPADEPADEPSEPSDEPASEPEPAAEPEPASEPNVEDEKDRRIRELEEQVRNLEEEVARLEEENGALKERVSELEGKSAADPASEEFERINKISKTGNKKIDRLIDLVNAR